MAETNRELNSSETSRTILTPEEREVVIEESRNGELRTVGSDLALLQAEREKFIARGGSSSEFRSSNNLVRVVEDRVVIQAVASEDTISLISDLQARGLTNISSFGKVVSGEISIEDLDDLASLDSLQFAQPAYKPITNVGNVTSQGDAAMQSDDARGQFSVDGSGVTIGVLSDSYNNLDGESADIASGDLPDDVNVLLDLESGGSDEGRAMLQLIYDVVPGADLAFRTAFISATDFATGIGELVDAGIDVIVDDIGYLDQPFFQDGIIAQAASEAFNQGVAYFSSAGNSGDDSYESTFNPGTNYAENFFSGGFQGGIAHQFAPGDELQQITLEAGESITLSFQWDDPFASTGGTGATRDLDIYLFDAEGTEVLASSTNNNIDKDAFEILGFTNDSEETQTYNLMLVHNTSVGSSESPSKIKYIDFDGLAEFNEYNTNSSTSFGHPNATGVVGVGAADFNNTPEFGQDPPLLEDFSSFGGTPILFDTAGNRLDNPEIRQQPQIVAPDGTQTTVAGFTNFFGTSAASPHAAAVAALMLDAAGGQDNITPTEIYQALIDTAIEMEDEGFDFKSGFGFINAVEAIEEVAAGINISETDGVTELIEGGVTTDTYSVVLNRRPSANVTIDFSTDADKLELSPNSLTFTADNWDVAQTVTVTATDDTIEGDSAAIITASVADGSADEYVNVDLGDIVVDIIDNDRPNVVIFQSDDSTNLSEDGTTDTYRVILTQQPTAPVTLNVIADGQIQPLNSLTFTADNWDEFQEVTVAAVNDEVAESDHTSTIQYEVAADSAAEYLDVSIDPITVNIADNDIAGATLTTTDGSNDVTESGLSDTYSLVLTSEPTQNVTVSFTFSAEGQVQLLNSESEAITNLTFTPGNWDTPQIVTVTAVNDDAVEDSPQPVTITHQVTAQGSAAEYQGVTIGDATVNVIDNDAPGITLAQSDGSTDVTEAGQTDTFRIILDRSPTANVTLNLSTNDQIQLLDASGAEIDSVTFTPENFNSFREITVKAIDDSVAEGPHTGVVNFAVSSDSAPEYLNVSLDPLTVNITEDDDAGIIVTETDESTNVNEDGQTDTYTLVLSSTPTDNVIIDINTDDQIADIVPLIFTPDNWDIPQTVTVTAADDKLVETVPYTSTISHSVRTGSASEYLNLPISSVNVNFTSDNDTAGVVITPSDETTEVTEGGNTDTYTIKLTTQPSDDVTIQLNTDEKLKLLDEAGLPITSVTFTPENFNETRTITVRAAIDDLLVTGDKTSTIAHTIASGSAAEYANLTLDSINVTIKDDPKDSDSTQQQSNFFSLPKLNGDPDNPDDLVTGVAPTFTSFANVAIEDNAAFDELTNVNFPIGFLDFDLFLVDAGDSPVITIDLPQSTDSEAYNTYWLYGATSDNTADHLFDFLFNGETGAEFIDTDGNGNADRVLLHFVDGGRGDADLEANGLISAASGAPGVITDDNGQPVSPPTLTTDDDVFVVGDPDRIGQTANLKFTLKPNSSEFVNEVGVFTVDANNEVDGIAPGESGFTKAAIDNAQVIFSSLNEDSNELLSGVNLTRQLSFKSGDRLMFYVVRESTTDLLLEGGSTSTLFFTEPTANPDKLDHFAISESDGNFNFAIEASSAGDDVSFDDVFFTLEQTQTPAITKSIANLQSTQEGEILDLTGLDKQRVTVGIGIVRSEASFDNIIGLYQIDDRNGGIDIDRNGTIDYRPGDADYARIATQERDILRFDRNSGTSVTIDGGGFLAPFIIADGNDEEEDSAEIYFPFLQGNRDGFDHLRILGENTFGFEDLPNGGDLDYNDAIFQVNLGVV
jgi:hypothetical protein